VNPLIPLAEYARPNDMKLYYYIGPDTDGDPVFEIREIGRFGVRYQVFTDIRDFDLIKENGL
jgi:hypothetical protein